MQIVLQTPFHPHLGHILLDQLWGEWQQFVEEYLIECLLIDTISTLFK